MILPLSEVSSNKLLEDMIGYTQVVHEPTHTSGSQIDYVYINSLLHFDACDHMRMHQHNHH